MYQHVYKYMNHLKEETDDFEEVIRFFPVIVPGPPVFYRLLAAPDVGTSAPPILPLPVKSGREALDRREELDILLISPVKAPVSFSR